MSTCLLLNATYEPLESISLERALILLFQEKAVLVHAKIDKFVHTISSTFPWPEVVRLCKFVYVKRKPLTPTKKNIFERDGACVYCGSTKHLTIDHVIPVSKGGLNTWKNLVTCCFDCNNKKGDKTLEEVGMNLKKEPGNPTHLHIIKKTAKDKKFDSWKDYIFT